MARHKHPKKDIENALQYAESHGWRLEVGGSHAWGKLYCPYNDQDCRCGDFCIVSVWSTPKNASNHARALRRVVDHCVHYKQHSENSSMEYSFTLKVQLASEGQDIDTLIERLAEAGCDDALVGSGRPGRLALEFTREADSAKVAVQSAIHDIRKAIPDAILVEASPDFVSLTEIADIVGISRQAMRKLMLTHQRSFPLPVHEGSVAIWHLAEVLDWFDQRGGYRPQEAMKETARAAWGLNLGRQQIAS